LRKAQRAPGLSGALFALRMKKSYIRGVKTTPLNSSTTTQKIVDVLKQELRSKGLRNHELAARLEVSETTVKRYLRGEGLDIPVLENLATIAELDLSSLIALAHQRGSSKPRLTMAQQEALARNPVSRSIFFLLRRGMTLAQIAQELALSTQKMETQLAKLEALLLIRRLPNNQCETLAVAYFDPRDQGPLMRVARNLAQRFLTEINLRSESCDWFYVADWLSPASIVRVREMIQRFQSEIRKLAESDVALGPREAKYYQFFIGAQSANRRRVPRSEG
jgi:DNA-binding NarL/FixJ family response regulator